MPCGYIWRGSGPPRARPCRRRPRSEWVGSRSYAFCFFLSLIPRHQAYIRLGRHHSLSQRAFLSQGGLNWYHELTFLSWFPFCELSKILLEQDWFSSAFMLS